MTTMKYDRDHIHVRVGETIEAHMMGITASARCTVPFFSNELLEDLCRMLGNNRIQGSSFVWRGFGANGIFHTGVHLQHLVDNPSHKSLRAYGDKCVKFVKALMHHPMPTVASVNGACFGGGLESALACRTVVCSPTSQLQFPELHAKSFPGMGGRLFANELTTLCLDTLNEGGIIRGPLYLHRMLPDNIIHMTAQVEAEIHASQIRSRINGMLDREAAAWAERMGRLLADPVDRQVFEAKAKLQESLAS